MMRLIKAALCIQACQTAPRVNCRQFEGDQLQGKAPTPTSLLSSTHPKRSDKFDKDRLKVSQSIFVQNSCQDPIMLIV